MLLCKFRDSLGIPGEGVHSKRFLGLALNDIIGTIIIIWILSRLSKLSLMKSSIVIITLTVLIHRIFCVNTAFNVAIFGNI